MLWNTLGAALLLSSCVCAIDVDTTSADSLRNAAATLAFNTMTNYTANHTSSIPGKLPSTWGRGALLFTTMLDYAHWTGDPSNDAAVRQGLTFQRGPDNNYMPANWTAWISNDDQLFWGLAAMTAAETGFAPADDNNTPDWHVVAANVFDTVVARWDDHSCDGGLRWQIYPYQAGYSLKPALSNGALFNLAARLARFADNQTYADWADRVWEWGTASALVDNTTWVVKGAVDVEDGCKTGGYMQWTADYAEWMSGAAYMFNRTNGSPKWHSAITGLLNSSLHTFFPAKYSGAVLSEVSCEPIQVCDPDQGTYKAVFVSALAATAQLVPDTAAQILGKLESSAQAAARQCSGGANGTLCGRRWYQAQWDGTASLEEAMSATSVVAANLLRFPGVGELLRESNGSEGGSEGTRGQQSADNNTSGTGDEAQTSRGGCLGASGMGVTAVVAGLMVLL